MIAVLFANLLVFKDVPRENLIPIMATMANSLGVACTYCHDDKAWDSDAKPMKEVARRMIRMTRAINDAHYGGKVTVTCNTCHHGSPQPASVPLVADAGWNKPATAALEPQLPPAEDLFARYVRLLGAVDTLQNRLVRGVVTARSGRGDPRSGPFELYQERPEKTEAKIELSYPPEANRELGPLFFRGSKLRERYSTVKTIGTDEIRGRSVYVVEAMPAGGGLPERLFFDALSGALLRRHHEIETIVGVLPEEYDFDDYRTIDGVLVPFLLQWSRADYQVTHRAAEIKQNLTR
ncbi:MAG TPA: c-type cytochrome [Thermoanaerobaculia bacterium]|nr:c-type cytochrome [Thermoanaerobaculia bacterium]